MSYGFNPDEVVTTKIDLIDKDGFHGVGTADGGNGGGKSDEKTSSLVFNEGIININVDYTGMSPTFSIFYVIDIKKHPEIVIMPMNNSVQINEGEIYFGDTIPDENLIFTATDDQKFYTADDLTTPIGVPWYSPGEDDITYKGSYIFGRSSYRIDDLQNELEELDGTPVHMPVAINTAGSNNPEWQIFQIHDVWHTNTSHIITWD